MTFPSWNEAMPYALSVARSFQQRIPIQLDGESLALEALWKAHLNGAVFTKGYVKLRVVGAIKDEMRRLGHGSRRFGYIDQGQFCDVANTPIEGAPLDLDGMLDAKRHWESMPQAARFLTRAFGEGKSSTDLALELGVSQPRIAQVAERLQSCPERVMRVPGRIDLRQELEWERQAVLKESAKGSVADVAQALGTSQGSAWRWMGPGRPPRPQFLNGQSGVVPERFRRRSRQLLATALERANGSVTEASRILGIPATTVRRWTRALVPELVKDLRVNPRVSTEEVLQLRDAGLSPYAIGKRLGVTAGLVRWRLGRLGHVAR